MNQEMGNIEKDDVINAITYYKSSKAGAIDNELTPKGAGVLGGVMTETSNSLKDYAMGNITKEDLWDSLKNTVASAAEVISHGVLDYIANAIKAPLALIPFVGVAVGKLIDVARPAIKSFVGSKAKEAVHLLMGTVKDAAKVVARGAVKYGKKLIDFFK